MHSFSNLEFLEAKATFLSRLATFHFNPALQQHLQQYKPCKITSGLDPSDRNNLRRPSLVDVNQYVYVVLPDHPVWRSASLLRGLGDLSAHTIRLNGLHPVVRISWKLSSRHFKDTIHTKTNKN
eukprot:1744914-Karenia_brevis.AAC.1